MAESFRCQLALAGLGGDVRTYQPTLSYTQFFPMRRKKSEHPEVFGFRIIAGTVGSFATSAKVRNSNSLAFVDGVPIFERFFLGDEFTIRGYNVRSISPLAPTRHLHHFDRTSWLPRIRSDDPDAVAGCARLSCGNIGVFTGITGIKRGAVVAIVYPIGADTQMLGNFEYRIPIIGNTVRLAAFADIGSAFNLRSKSDQFFNSNFLDDQPFLSTVGFIPLSAVARWRWRSRACPRWLPASPIPIWPLLAASAVFRVWCCATIAW